MRQFVKVLADGRVSVIHTTAATPLVADGDTLIETTDAPIPRGVDVAVVDGAVVTTPRVEAPPPAWTNEEEPPA